MMWVLLRKRRRSLKQLADKSDLTHALSRLANSLAHLKCGNLHITGLNLSPSYCMTFF